MIKLIKCIVRLILESDFGDKIHLFYIVRLQVHLNTSFILAYVNYSNPQLTIFNDIMRIRR